MIPLKDDIPSSTFPYVNMALILANAAVFIYSLTLGQEFMAFLYRYGMVPILFQAERFAGTYGAIETLPEWVLWRSLVTSLFLHGGWIHFLGNMLYLWIFGDNVEDRMGHGRYLIFYLLCGVGANVIHLLVEPMLAVPTVGASGAIAGVLGAYFLLYPRAWVIGVVPVFFFLYTLRLPAFVFLLFWFLQQFLSGLAGRGANVAWWAHIGGFVLGLVLVRLFQRPERRPPSRETWWRDRYDPYGRG